MEPRVISTEGEARFVVAVLEGVDHIGIDCEGLNLGINGEVTIIQIVTGGSSPVAYLFDVQECPAIAPILKPILESKDIVKVIHDCRSDRTNLLKDFGIRLGPVFDTQIAYKYIYPDSLHDYKYMRIGWNNLCKFYNASLNPLKDKFHNIYKTNPAIWKKRPLTRDMLIYASADVGNLPLFYKKMKKKIAEMGKGSRARFEKECRTAKR